MALPKGIAARQVWTVVALTVWMLFWMFLISALLLDSHVAIDAIGMLLSMLLIIIPLAFGPLAWYLFVLRKRVQLAAQPHGEQLLELKTKESELAALNGGKAIGAVAQVAVLVLSGLFCVGLLGYQIYMYLRYGEWISRGWADMGWPIPQTGWIGLQNILNWIAQGNAGVLIFVGGFLANLMLGDDDSSAYHRYCKEQEIEKLRKELTLKGERNVS